MELLLIKILLSVLIGYLIWRQIKNDYDIQERLHNEDIEKEGDDGSFVV